MSLLRGGMDCAQFSSDCVRAAARAKTKKSREERTHETQSQAVCDRGGDRHRLVRFGYSAARADRRRHRQRRHRRRGDRHERARGVWVIAETTDLPTKFAKMVVTDDQGRYVVPDLPKAKYKVWVRGYGLVDSPKVDGEPGKQVNLSAVPAPNDAEAAKYYPAIYWYSMMKVPDASEFGKKDGEIPDKITQSEWLSVLKNRACVGCHQLGQLSTRTIPAAFGEFKSGEDAWRRRTMSGQAAPLMINPLAGYLG